jgi:hypothetical protein
VQASLLLVTATTVTALVLQVCTWRLLRPKRYLVWVPLLFLVAGFLVAAFLTLASPVIVETLSDEQIVAACMLYGMIVTCYTGGFAGVVEYSPSAEILREVSAHHDGVRQEDLNVRTLSESALTGKRIRHLLRNGLITIGEDGELALTASGRRVVAGCLLYRTIFGLKERAVG